MRVPSLLLILALCSETASESRTSPSELDEVTTNSLEDQLAQDRQGWMRDSMASIPSVHMFKIILIQLGVPAQGFTFVCLSKTSAIYQKCKDL